MSFLSFVLLLLLLLLLLTGNGVVTRWQ